MKTRKRKCGNVWIVPVAKDGSIMENWPKVGWACSRTGAIRLVHKYGYRVVKKGGNIEFSYVPGDSDDGWSVMAKRR